MADEAKRTRKKMVFIGVRPGSDSPKVFLWYNVEGLEPGCALDLGDQARRWAAGPKKRGQNIAFASPGQVYSFEFDDEGFIYPSTNHYEGLWADEEAVRSWQAESRAIDNEIDSRTTARKDAKQRLDLEALEPIREAYQRMNWRQQQHFLAEVIRYITSHRKGKEE